MAVLGVQVIFSMVMFTFLHKIAPYYSFGRWILSKRLYRYLHPTNEELRQLMSGKTTLNSKAKRRNEQRKNMRDDNKTESFTVPRNLPIQLDQAVVEDIDLLSLQYYSDYIWLVDFSFSTIFVYVCTEIYYVFAQHRIEINLSLLWCLMAIVFCVRILMSQAWLYMQTQEGGERILLVTFTFFFLVFAMGVLVVGDGIIEFGIEEGYRNFSGNALEFLDKQGTKNYGPMSFMTFKGILAFCGMLIGGLLTFPGLRMAKLHLDTLKYNQGRKIVQILLQANYLLPLTLIVLWIKPAGRDILCGKSFAQRRVVLYEDQFEGLRLLLILATCFIKILLMPLFLQSHLNLAHERIESMKKETGRISNIELQKIVARVFYYLCVVSIQYIAPVFIIIFLTFMLKTLSGGSWASLFGEVAVNYFSDTSKVPSKYTPLAINENSTVAAFLQSTSDLTMALGDVKGIFSPVWYKGIFTYFMWWVTTAWFSSTSLGVIYYSQSL